MFKIIWIKNGLTSVSQKGFFCQWGIIDKYYFPIKISNWMVVGPVTHDLE